MITANVQIVGEPSDIVHFTAYLAALGADFTKENVELETSVCFGLQVKIPDSLYQVEKARTRNAGAKKKDIKLTGKAKKEITKDTTLSDFIAWASKDKTHAASVLGISRPSVYKRIKQAKEIIENWKSEDVPTVKEIGIF